MKEIHICIDGVILVYRYEGKVRYITHHFYKPHNGEMVKVSIVKEETMTNILCKLKEMEMLK